MITQPFRFVRPVVSVIIVVVCVFTSTTVKSQDKIEAARKRIDILLRKAEELQDKGAAEKAEQLIKTAQALNAQLAKASAERAKKISEAAGRKEAAGERQKILRGLKSGAAALRALGRAEDAERLEKIAAELQGKARDGQRREAEREREAALKQIKVMQIARQGLLDAGREDSAEMMEHAIAAQELALEGRRDEKAARVRESAPSLGQRVELLMFAAKKLRDAGKKEQAAAVANLGERLLKTFRARQNREREGDSRRRGQREKLGGPEHEAAVQQVEVMKTALVALREGQREDAADLLQRAIQARLVRLKRLAGEEAKLVLEREPKLAHTVEALGLAAKLWREFGDSGKAAVVGKLADRLGGSEGAKEER